MNRTDVVSENEEFFARKVKGLEKNIKKIKDVDVIEITIKTNLAKQLLLKEKGRYITIQHRNLLDISKIADVEDVLTEKLMDFLKDKQSVLFIGVGNKKITPDSIGPFVAEKIIATRHLNLKIRQLIGADNLKSVSVFSPGVSGQTGMQTIEIIKSVVNFVKPELVVVVDALAARSFSRLGRTIQITDSGIAPGSGVKNSRQELSKKTLGVPVLAIGVPTVVDFFENKAKTKKTSFFMVTPKNIDEIINRAAGLISNSLNRALFPNLSKKELKALC